MNCTNQLKALVEAVCLTMLSFFLCIPSFAQTGKTIKGKVVDSKNEVLVGVGVQEKGTTNGVATDLDGTFSITLMRNDATLVFSSIGYTTEEIKVGSQAVINVTLKDDTMLLDDVVVVGYGSQLKKSVTGAISSVKEKDFKAPNSVSVDAALQGKVAGLTLNVSSAQPGSGVSANIRGNLSPNGSNAPLYVIDGVVISSNSNNASKVGPDRMMGYALRDGANRSPLATINPNDIASIDVLKDASAAAIYGSAAANGVILITTKKGQSGKPQVQYSGSVSVSKIGKYYEMLDAWQYMEQSNLATKEEWLWGQKYAPYGPTAAPSSGWPVRFTQDEIDSVKKSYNHIDEVTRTGLIHDHNLSITGGTDKFKVFTSFNFYDNTAVLKGSDLQRISGRINFDAQVLKWLKISVNSMYTQNKANNPSIGHWRENANEANLTNSALYFPPTRPLRNEDGELNNPDNPLSNNPLKYLMIKDVSTTKRIFFTPNIEVKFTPWLKANVVVAVDNTDDNRSVFSPKAAKLVQQTTDNFGGFSNGYNTNSSAEEYITFDKTFGKHYVNAVVGTGYYKAMGSSYSFTAHNLPTDALENNALQLSSDKDNATWNSHKWERTKLSFFGRANYSYDDRYVVGITMRYDGSSVFAKNHKFGFFPGISAAWNISNEQFMKNASWVDFLKLRAGYGTSGNESILAGNHYTLNTYGAANSGGWYYFNGVLTNGIYQLQKGNPNLKWETDITANIGLDWTLFGGRLAGSIDGYVRTAKDLLDFATLPINDVMNKMAKNIGKTRSTGVELAIRGTMIDKKDWTWSAYFNIAHNYSQWVERNPEVALNPWQSEKDGLSDIFGWETDGIFTSYEEAQNSKLQPGSYPGTLKYVDQNGDGKLDKDDVVKLGNGDPFAVYGIGTTLRWKNLTLDIDGYGVLGQYRGYGWGYTWLMTGDPINHSVQCLDRWTSYNTNGFLTGIATDVAGSNNPSGTNDYLRKQTHFLRLKNIKLTYSLPQNVLNSCRISNASIFIDFQNSLLLTNYEGLDPEMEQNSSPFPIPYTGVLGINLTF